MKDNIYLTLILSDFKKNKLLNSILFLFIFIATLLMSTGVLILERVSGSLDEIFETAKPPHYLQMHIGDINEYEINNFLNETSAVEKMQIQNMVNIEGVNIFYEKNNGETNSFSDSLLDNYFVVQNSEFDYLVNLNNEIVQVNEGEIGIPIVYAKKYNIEANDIIKIKSDKEEYSFLVKHIVRDAQMASSLASSIRFLINENDYNWISENFNNHEYIISFRLIDEKYISDFNALYNDEIYNMPRNGVGITLPIIKVLNGISDGLTSAIIIFISIIMVVIAVLNIKFTIQSTLEEEIKTIGTLKAIGLKSKEINNLYKYKYQVFTLLACILAVICSFAFVNLFLDDVSLNFGIGKITALTYVLPFICVIIVYFIVILSLNKTLKNISNMSTLSLLIGEKNSNSKVRNFKIFFKNLDLSLSIHEFFINIKPWLVYTLVFLLGTFSILIPLNIYTTFTSPSFVNYVGVANSDLQISIDYNSQISVEMQNIENNLKMNDDIEEWNKFKLSRVKIYDENNKVDFLVEIGDYSNFPIEMEEGYLPKLHNEIALSVLNADRFNVGLNDKINIELNNEIKIFEVVGVYQDITNGGLTSKITYDNGTIPYKYTYFLSVKNGVNIDELEQNLSNLYTNAKVIKVEKLIQQVLGTVISSLSVVVMSIFILSIVVLSLICILFIILQMHRNFSQDTTFLAIGYNIKSIRLMYMYKSFISIIFGVLIGAMLSLKLGEIIMSILLTSMNVGITNLKFIINPISFIILGIFIPTMLGLLTTWMVTKKIAKNNITDLQ